MADSPSGWNELFNPEDEFEDGLPRSPHTRGAQDEKLERYLELQGVRGAIQVTLDGVVLQQHVPGDVQYYAALTAAIGSTARQVDRMMALQGLEYAVVRMSADTHSTMIFREQDTFIGLLLSGEIAPTHIITRLRGMNSGNLG